MWCQADCHWSQLNGSYLELSNVCQRVNTWQIYTVVTYGIFDKVILCSNLLELCVRLSGLYSIRQSLIEKMIKFVLVGNGVAELILVSISGRVKSNSSCVPAIGKR
jgi:hypothetical protein